ncbi:Nitrate/nitrite transporter [Caballeronia glathei]|uniref:Membrane protein n=1 Tax=Caballeronia glathei TaxID=60547 RepID=A0A069PCZ1_9BURK|nr:MFS transporter [Caballeronia glathei]KDR38495.1 membrane protein [Caballeronia glathei]CDY75008.1 Nitrate/nitrite transporter [Caballeronia glathei]
MENTLEASTISRIYRRLVPLLFVLLIINYLDRVNIGFAALRMNQDLGFSATVFGLGAGIFFVGYAVFEVPSNIMLHRFGARIWIARIMVTWGLVSAGLAFVHSTTSFYVLRFLLGVAEAGFIPGVVAYLAYWFPVRYRSRANAGVIMATAIASAIGSPVSGILMHVLEGSHGFSGWRWMLLLEAVPAVVLGLFVLVWLTDRPERATWLRADQRNWLVAELASEASKLTKTASLPFIKIAMMGRVWSLSALFVCFLTAFYGVLLWLPQIIKHMGTMSDLQVGFVTALPFCCAAVSMYLVARHSDKVSERRLHIAVCMSVGGLALLACAFVVQPVLGLALLCVAAGGIWGCLAVFWTLTGEFLTGAAAAIGIALINTIGQCGGLLGPWLVGVIKDLTGNFSVALIVLAVAAFLAALIAFLLPDRAAPSPAKTALRADPAQ